VFIPALGAIFGPALRGLANAFNTIKNAVASNSEELAPLLALFKAVWTFTKDNLAPLLGGAFKLALEGIAFIAAGLVNTFSNLVGFLTNTFNAVKKIIDFVRDNPITNFLGSGNSKDLKAKIDFQDTDGGGAIQNPFQSGAGTGLTGIISPATGADIGVYSPAMQAAILRREELKAETARLRAERESNAAARVTVNMGIVGDPESAARTIVDVLNKSQARGTLGAGALFAV